ncbi:DUF418 domain-containing protein [Allobacillus sp. GCM10007491]|uniref:DUF418 domain-containing protein n=1 Tax=Allobacillus saliphilus TaxID=2912308 RepID=A0A941HU73_9BACI|nr:DUF418 domain-containing protein [Allobacillus saliphilus]MBR7554590.1 DUF418 domain-containing protein [Allobacillus saliphilus]
MNAPTKNRIISVDAIRGFSLFGILVVNILSFHSPHFVYGGKQSFYETMATNGEIVDSSLILTVIDLFFQASFYPLFSLLFGIGLWIMYEKRDSLEAKRILIKRMFILMGIGLLHGIFIWYGDILFSYSIVGLIAIRFLQVSIKKLLIWAISLLAVPTILFTLAAYSVREQMVVVYEHEINKATEAYRGTYSEIFQQNLSDWLLMVDPIQLLLTVMTILPMFLFGIIIGRLRLFDDVKKYKQMIWRIIGVTFVIAVVFKAGPYLFENKMWLNFMQDSIGGSASAIFYFFALLMLLTSLQKTSILVKLFSSVGRLSLSNYLLQSIIGFWLFYGVGMNLYGTQPLSKLMLFVVIIYFIQLVVSYFFLKKFRIGPFEWLYRSLTYGKIMGFKEK